MIDKSESDSALGESVVDEVRAIREAIDAESDHDIRKLAEQARRVSEQVRREYGMKVAEIATRKGNPSR